MRALKAMRRQPSWDMHMNSVIQVEGLNKSFGGKQVLFNLGLAVQPGEMLALIGASGSGKSTLLRHLAGLACGDRHDTSSIRILGKPMQAVGRLHRQVRNVRSARSEERRVGKE